MSPMPKPKIHSRLVERGLRDAAAVGINRGDAPAQYQRAIADAALGLIQSIR